MLVVRRALRSAVTAPAPRTLSTMAKRSASTSSSGSDSPSPSRSRATPAAKKARVTTSSPAKSKARTASAAKSPNTSDEDEDGKSITLGKGRWRDWPAPLEQMQAAREFVVNCVQRKDLVIIVPDKDADGLSSCMILHRTLTTLGLPEDKIKVHLLLKGTSLFKPVEEERLEKLIRSHTEGTDIDSKPSSSADSPQPNVSVIVLDQGSRPGPPLVPKSAVPNINLRTLILDHHMSDAWPDEAQVLTACHSPPIATSSLLSYLTCSTLHPDLPQATAWYCLLGLFGDLGPSEVNFAASRDRTEWPVAAKEMAFLGETSKTVGKKALNSAVGALNAPRRTAEYNVQDAWDVLFRAKTPDEIARSGVLQDARDKVNREVERCTHTAPKFSKDGRVALLRIDSGYQVHPVIATRWSGTLKGAKKLLCIMVENYGHQPDPEYTSFSCRIPSSMRKLPEGERPNLIALLKEFGELTGDGFLERVGEDFARGHKEATGGIIKKADFELFAEKGMEIGVKDPNAPPTKREKKNAAVQSNTLGSYFKITPKKEAAKEEVAA